MNKKVKFDPDAAAAEGSGIYGLPFTAEESKVLIIPVPFEATTSYGSGTSKGPEAIFEASKQVDLTDYETGKPYEAGIAMLETSKSVKSWSRQAKSLAGPIIAKGGAVSAKDYKVTSKVDVISEKLNQWVYQKTKGSLQDGGMPIVLGGDHSTPFGAIQAYAEKYPGMGILHVDAHADLRKAYEGFTWSHASIFYNVMNKIDGVSVLVQAGLRDIGSEELEIINSSKKRIVGIFDADIASRKEKGEAFAKIADRIVSKLPKDVYISWDIDGLDPALCPGTGTPVPGGFSWNEAIGLLRALKRAKKRIVGFDLCEVSPGSTEWNANVGARLLYKMIGYALLTR